MPYQSKPQLAASTQQSGGLFRTAGDLFAAPFRGVEGAVQDVYGLADTLTGDVLPDWDDRFLGNSKTTAGGIVEGFSNFLTGFVPVVGWVGRGAKVGRGLKLASGLSNSSIAAAKAAGKTGQAVARRLGRDAVAGAVVDFAVFDGHEERLSNLIQQSPTLANPISAFLAADEEDGEVVGRLKNVIEGAGLGILADGLLEALGTLRTVRKARAAGKSASEVDDLVEAAHDGGKIRSALYEPKEVLEDTTITPVELAASEAESLLPVQVKTPKGGKAIVEALKAKSPQAGEDIQLFIDSVGPRLFDDVGLEFGGDAAGRFDYASGIVSIGEKAIKSGTLTRTTLHELWHNLEQYVPADLRKSLDAEYQADLGKAIGDNPSLQAKLEAGEQLGAEEYRFGSFEEWFAEVMADKSARRIKDMSAPVQGIMAHAKAIFSRIVTGIRNAFGGKATDRALNDFFHGKYEVKVSDYTTGGRLSDPLTSDSKASFLTRFGLTPEDSESLLQAVRDRSDLGIESTINPREKLPNGSYKYTEPELLEMHLERRDLNLSRYQGPEDAHHLIREVEDMFRATISEDPGVPSVTLNEQQSRSFQELAQMLGEDNEQAFMANAIKDARNATEAYAALNSKLPAFKMIQLHYSNEVVKSYDKVLGSSATDADLLEMSSKMEFLGEITSAIRGMSAEQGRGLASNRIPTELVDLAKVAKDGTRESETIRKSIDEAIDDLGGRAHLRKVAERAKKAFGEGGPEGIAALNKTILAPRSTRIINILNEMFINNILSGTKTLMVNTVSGAYMSIWRPMENLLGGGLNTLLAAGRGADVSPHVKEMHRSLRQLTGMFTEFTAGFQDAMRFAIKAGTTGQSIIDPGKLRRDLGPQRAISAENLGLKSETTSGQIANWIGNVWNIPSSILTGTDEFIKQINTRATVRAELVTQGLDKGLSHEALGDFVSTQMNQLFYEGQAYSSSQLYKRGKQIALDNPEIAAKGDEAVEKYAAKWAHENFDESLQTVADVGISSSREATFTTALKPGSLSSGIQKLLQQHPFWRLFVPFVRTPTNIAVYAADRITAPFRGPLAAIQALQPSGVKRLQENGSKLAQQIASGDPKLQADASGRIVAGAGLFASFTALATAGNITGRGPSDPEQRRLLLDTGWQPYSVRLGDGSFLSYARIDPFATMIGTAADLFEYSSWSGTDHQSELEMGAMAFVTAVANNFTNKTYLSGVQAVVEALGQPERKMEALFERYASAFVPGSSFLNQAINSPQDDLLRDVRGVVDAMQSRIPGLADNLEPIRNVLGEPILRSKSFGAKATEVGGYSIADAFLPVAYRESSDDIISNEMRALQHGFSPPRTTSRGVELVDFKSEKGQSAYDRYSQLHGEVKIGGKNLRQTLRQLIKSKGYQRTPIESTPDVESPRIALMRRVISRYRRKAFQEMLKEYPEVQQEIGRIDILETLAKAGQ